MTGIFEFLSPIDLKQIMLRLVYDLILLSYKVFQWTETIFK